MRNYLITSIFLLLFLHSTLFSQDDTSIIVTDDLGIEFKFTSIPQKIITLAPNLTEFIYVLGVENKLVGNTTYCNFPKAANEVEKIGDILTVDYEKILTLNPDLIFITVEGNTKSSYEKLQEFGFKVFTSNPRDYCGIKKTLTDLGMIFKLDDSVSKKIAKWDSVVNRIEELSQSEDSGSIMFVVELRPLMLAGKNTFINQYIEYCGLRNFAQDSPLNYPIYSREEVLKSQPDYIVFPSDGVNDINDILNTYPEWINLNSIKENRIMFVDRDLYFRPGPRFIIALEDLFKNLSLVRIQNHQEMQ